MLRILLFLMLSATATAQSLTPAGVAPLNHQFAGGGYQLTATLGLPAFSHYTAGSYMLTEGLQQPMRRFSSVAIVAAPQLRVYPNPAHEALFIDYPAALQTQILDLTGRQVNARALEFVSDGQWRLPLDDLAAGPYILRLTSAANQVFIYKIIVY